MLSQVFKHVCGPWHLLATESNDEKEPGKGGGQGRGGWKSLGRALNGREGRDTTVSTIGGHSNDRKQERNRARRVLKWSSWLSQSMGSGEDTQGRVQEREGCPVGPRET